jgi:hypothetical protein
MFGSFRDLAFLGAAAGGGVATPLLLDLYPGAAVAYSLRNLSTAYTGPVVRVRRSSDNTEQDFTAAQVTDGTLTTFCGASDGLVRTWYDQSGNARNATQTTTNAQPRIVLAGALEVDNGSPSVKYRTTLDSLTFEHLTTIRSYFLLARNAIGPAAFYHSHLLGTAPGFEQPSFHGGTATWLDPGFSSANARNGQNRINGELVNYATAQRNTERNLFSMITLGSTIGGTLMQQAARGDRSWSGPVQEVLIYTTDQTASRAAIEANINAHYAIY